jgi:hypothetical protein
MARPPSAPAQRAPTAQGNQRQGPAAVQRAPQTRTVQPPSQPRERAVERSRAPDRANRQTQERRQQLQQRRAQPGPQGPAAKQVETRRPGNAARNGPQVGKRGQPGAQPVARVQATDQQRRQVRDGLFRGQNVQRIPRSRLNVPLTVGSHIPRNHRLYRFTPALLALVPMYAAYSYLVVDDTICVVDPETYAVVDVIPSSIEQAGPGPYGGRLALSTEQMRCIYEGVPRDEARVDLRIRLALGAEVPRDVMLTRFPERTLGCAPALADLGYIVVENDVVIVDPADYAIVQVISE